MNRSTILNTAVSPDVVRVQLRIAHWRESIAYWQRMGRVGLARELRLLLQIDRRMRGWEWRSMQVRP